MIIDFESNNEKLFEYVFDNYGGRVVEWGSGVENEENMDYKLVNVCIFALIL